jgi:hypothetical protein
MRFGVMAVGAILGSTAAASAAAQQLSLPGAVDGRQLSFAAQGEVVYDTNFARGDDLTAAQRGLSKADTIYRPSLSVTYAQPIGQQGVFLNGSVGYDFHQKNTQRDRGRANVQGGVVGRVGPCAPNVQGAYRIAQSDLDDEDNGRITNLLQTDSAGVGVQCTRGIGPGFSLQVEREHTNNSATSRRPSDHDSKVAAATLFYAHPTLGQASLTWVYMANEFPNRIIPGRPVGDGFFTNSYGISYQRNFGSKLVVGGQYARTTVKREFAPPGSDLKLKSTSYGVNVSYKLGQRIDLQAHATRAVKPSNRPGKLYDIRTNAEASMAYTLGTRYNISAGYGVTDNDSNNDTVPGTKPVVTKSRMDSAFGAIGYKQSDRLSFTLTLRHDDRKADLPDFNYSATRIGLSTSLTF